MATMDSERGKRLRLIRKTLGENQIEFGSRFDKTGPAISNYERGRLPEDEILKNLYEMGFSIDWLLSGEGYMHRRMNTLCLQDEVYGSVLESFADGVTIVQDGVHKYVNSAMEHIMECSKDELIGRSVESHVLPSEKARIGDMYKKNIDGEVLPDHDIFTIRIGNGKTKDIKTSFASIQFRGKPAILTIVREIGQGSDKTDFPDRDLSLQSQERKLVRILKVLLSEMVREEG
jgi:PAS domain S-box-containing protein